MSRTDPIGLYSALQVYLPPTETFVHVMLTGLGTRTKQLVLARHLESPDDWPGVDVEHVPTVDLTRPEQAMMAACRLRERHRGQILQTWLGNAACDFTLLKHFLQVPMVAMVGGTDVRVYATWPATARLYEYMFKHAEAFTPMSESLRDRLIELGCPPEKTHVIPSGVDTDLFAPPADRGDREGPMRLLMVGRLIAVKGQAAAVRALSSLPAEAGDWRLNIVGDGPEAESIRQAARAGGIADRVDLLGLQPPERVLKELKDADIFVHTSVTTPEGHAEGLGHAIMEAQATGLAVVGTRHGGIPELVIDGRTGLLVPEHDEPAIAAAVERLIGDPALRQRLGEAARQHVIDNYSIGHQVERYVALYEELLDRYPPGCPELRRVPEDDCLPALVRACRREHAERFGAAFSDRFRVLRGDGLKTRVANRLRWALPAGVKTGLKGVYTRLFGTAAVDWEAHAQQDDAFWARLQQTGLDEIAPAGDREG